MFSGLMSRWTMPALCATDRPLQTCRSERRSSAAARPSRRRSGRDQIAAGDQLHAEEQATVGQLAEVVDLDDVGGADPAAPPAPRRGRPGPSGPACERSKRRILSATLDDRCRRARPRRRPPCRPRRASGGSGSGSRARPCRGPAGSAVGRRWAPRGAPSRPSPCACSAWPGSLRRWRGPRWPTARSPTARGRSSAPADRQRESARPRVDPRRRRPAAGPSGWSPPARSAWEAARSRRLYGAPTWTR